ncbi:DNA-binding protein [Erwinia amylovora]|uniref:DNA-binding protein n=1 Tax=Erwinia amylovora TaxID=552 RepID=UPI0014443963|nr:DNA-binding protein [Erwinia amylovora]
MRDYATVSPQFWLGKTGRELRCAGAEAQVVAFYLITSPHANMLGLYYLPVLYLAHETGLGLEGASKGLERAIKAGFCSYDEHSEMVWVHEMAGYQVGRSLKPGDNRCAGVRNEYASLPENPFLPGFFERYQADFLMTKKRGKERAREGAFKVLSSQDQEQDQDQELKENMSDSKKKPNQTPPAGNKKYPDEFETLWREYPGREGSNSKAGAYKTWKARIRDGVHETTMLNAVLRYRAYCQSKRIIGTEFVKLARTFLGPNHEFENTWEIKSEGINHGKNIPANGESSAARVIRAEREQWEREHQQTSTGHLAAVGTNGPGVWQPLDNEEWIQTVTAVDNPGGEHER